MFRFILDNKDAAAFLVPLIFIAAWLIGTLTEFVTFLIVRWPGLYVLKVIVWFCKKIKLHKIFSKKFEQLEKIIEKPLTDYALYTNGMDDAKLRILQKEAAEEQMFRSLMIISFVETIISHWTCYFFICATLVFGLAYVRWKMYLLKFVKIAGC
jgi:hypothetical protein